MVLIAVDLDDVLAQVSRFAPFLVSASASRSADEIGADPVGFLPPSVGPVTTDKRKGGRAVSVSAFLVRLRSRWRGSLGCHEPRSYASSSTDGRTSPEPNDELTSSVLTSSWVRLTDCVYIHLPIQSQRRVRDRHGAIRLQVLPSVIRLAPVVRRRTSADSRAHPFAFAR